MSLLRAAGGGGARDRLIGTPLGSSSGGGHGLLAPSQASQSLGLGLRRPRDYGAADEFARPSKLSASPSLGASGSGRRLQQAPPSALASHVAAGPAAGPLQLRPLPSAVTPTAPAVAAAAALGGSGGGGHAAHAVSRAAPVDREVQPVEASLPAAAGLLKAPSESEQRAQAFLAGAGAAARMLGEHEARLKSAVAQVRARSGPLESGHVRIEACTVTRACIDITTRTGKHACIYGWSPKVLINQLRTRVRMYMSLHTRDQ